MRTLLVTLTFALPALLLTACGEAPAEPIAPAVSWGTTIAYEADVKLGGCDVGDLDPASPGAEIAAVAGDGTIHLVQHGAEGWTGAQIAKTPGEMIQCAIGDVDPTRDGNELVVVGIAEGTEDTGGKGAAYLVFRDGDAWAVEKVFEDTALVHGVAVGDVDPDHPGAEIVAVGFSKQATILGKTEAGWTTLAQVALPGAGKDAVCVGVGFAVANTSNGVALVSLGKGGGDSVTSSAWTMRTAEVKSSQGRIDFADGNLLVGCDDGSLQLGTPDGSFRLWRDTNKLRGAVLADLDPTRDGLEAATGGYSKTLTILYPPEGNPTSSAWSHVTLWRDTGGIHHVAAGELLADGQGLEIVAVGYSGRVVVASLRTTAR